MSALTRPGDPLEDPKVLGLIEDVGLTNEPPPVGTWESFGEATAKGIPRGLLEFDATGQRVFGDIGARARWIGGAIFSSNELDQHQEAWELDEQYREDTERNDQLVREKLTESRRFRPDPLTTGAAGQIGNEVTAVVPRTIGGTVVGGPVGGAVAAGAPAGFAESDRLQQEGVDAATANKAGAITGITTGVGAVLPGGGFVKGVVADTALAAAGNVGLGVAQRKAVHEILSEAGYQAQADQYRALDKTAMATDLAFSLVLSGAHRLSTRETNAVLTSRNALHFARGDGLVPTDAASGRAMDEAKTNALGSLLAGKPVNVAEGVRDASALRDPSRTPAELPEEVHAEARAEDRAADAFDLVADRIIGLESGGRANAKNPRSSATGAGQFVQRTWLDLLARTRPDLVAGKSREQQLALRTDPDLSREMVIAFARENGQGLQAAGLPVTPANLYLAHHFGSAGAVKLLRASPDSLVFDHLNAGEKVANPAYKGKTVEQMLAGFERRAGARKDVGTSEALTVVAYHGTDAAPFTEFDTDRPPHAWAEGETGAFFTTDEVDARGYGRNVIRAEVSLQRPYETTEEAWSTPGAALTPREAKERGFDGYIVRNQSGADTVVAFRKEQIRVLRGDETSSASPAPAGEVPPGMVRLYHGGAFDGENVTGEVHFSTSRSYAEGYAAKTEGAKVYHLDVPESLLDRDLANGIAGRSSIALPAEQARAMQLTQDHPLRANEGALGRADEPVGRRTADAEPRVGGQARRAVRQGEPEQRGVLATTDALRRVAAERPRQQVLIGTDVDGNPIYVSLADALASLEADRAIEIREARAFAAGADCYLRTGA